MSEFKDYPADQIAAKLAQIDRFERTYKPNATSKSWRKWCTDYEYRKREWQLRQSVANSIKPNTNYYKENTIL
jgi:hypothetical protein